MASKQAAPLTSVSTEKSNTSTASNANPSSQHLGLPHSSSTTDVLDGAYYLALLQEYLSPPHRHDTVPPNWGDIGCLSISAESFEWKTDWQSPSPEAAHLCMLRGRILPKHLYNLTNKFNLSPAFLAGYLGGDLEPYTMWPICPPLPSQRSNMGHVRFLTLGQTWPLMPRFDFRRMPVRRQECRNATRELAREPQSSYQFGETRVRDVHLHNHQYFSVEQVISFCFVRGDQKDPWVGELDHIAETICEHRLTCHRRPFE
jgi:hypothetical protein